FMKLAFIADIHGNATALNAVLKDINKQKVDEVFVLGDVCYRGLDPLATLDMIRALQVRVIKGNADEWITRGVRKGEVRDDALEIMQLERDWTVTQLDDSSLDYLEKLPSQLNIEQESIKIHAFHATPTSLFDVVTPDVSDETLREKMLHQTE